MGKVTKSDNPSEGSVAAKLLTETLGKVAYWRSNKKNPSESIPNHLWEEVFQLEQHYSSAFLRGAFKISNKQYQAKQEALHPTEAEVTSQTFVECHESAKNHDASAVSLELQEVKPVIKDLYKADPLPSAKTVIVELCRADGQIMKIHTTQDSVPSLMQQFYGKSAC